MTTNWSVLELNEVFQNLRSEENGLSAEEAAKRTKEFGLNILPEAKRPGLLSIFLSQFLSPLIYILIAAAALVFFMGEAADAIIIFLVLIFNAIVGTIQEGKAQRTLLALRKFTETSAAAQRDGKVIILPDKEIVPGDVIIIQEGDKIPADARIISENSLKIDESSMTGESGPVEKIAGTIKQAVPVHDQKNMVFKGTHALSGNGKAVVVATGLANEIGKISKTIAAIDTEIPLKKNIRLLSRLIIVAMLSIGATLLVFGILAGEPLRQMFATVVSLSVSIIPEGLPIVMTLVLASGVWRMTKRSVLVKRLQAVEALGQAKIIAVDKTGTLTKNEMVLGRVFVDGKTFEVGGFGYEPKGQIFFEGMAVEPLNHPELVFAGRVASFCSNARAMYIAEKGVWKVSGDPTEAALEVFSRKIGFKDEERESPRLFELPFDYLTKYHATLHKFEKKNFLTVVGAPEKIFELCNRVWRAKKSEKLTKTEKEKLESEFFNLSKQGFRVLAFAVNPVTKTLTLKKEKLPPLILGGFFGIKDPLREGVKEVIQKVHEAGIRVVMITGDHKITAYAVAKEAGLAKGKENVITGEELEKLSDEELLEKFGTCNVFARVTPENKLRIIELFRKRGEVVAMTGDGVNDAPSLIAADLGVAMGKIGTEVAKEASDLVLLDDNFGNIAGAVEEGRSIYKTMKKVILYLFSTSIGEVLAIAGAIFLGFPLPLLPAQIIWLNFVTDGFLDVALAMEPKEKGLLNNRFTKTSKYILDAFSAKRMMFMGIIIALGALFVFSYYLNIDIEKALTMSLTTLAIFQWFNAWNCKSENKSIFSVNPFKNLFLVGATILVIALQAFAVYHPFMQKFLHTSPLAAGDWFFAGLVAASIILFEEIRKLLTKPKGL